MNLHGADESIGRTAQDVKSDEYYYTGESIDAEDL